MFGEAESESPRVPSPWDALSSSNAPSPALRPTLEIDGRKRIADSVPKLAPEVEEGNVEYKLKLINPSPERFTRLCTQLKWRLLEGGGQAYYELGVADSGQLIGLTREDMEKSLETLEMMAGEIGASVIVVKEIEVPGQLIDLGLRARSGYPDRASPPRRGGPSPASNTEDETPSATDGDDDGSDEMDDSVVTPENDGVPRSSPRPIAKTALQHRHHLDSSASPSPSNLSPAQLPSEDVEEVPEHTGAHFTLEDLEIQTVYKPRPTRSPPARLVAASPGSKAARRQYHAPNAGGERPAGGKSRKNKSAKHAISPEDKQQRMAIQRAKRDQKREEKRRALLALAGLDSGDTALAKDPSAVDVLGLYDHDGKTDSAVVVPAVVVEDTVLAKDRLGAVSLSVGDTGQLEVELPSEANQACVVAEERTRTEPRIIVEALVVRKLALEEAFLDFGGFSLGP